MLNQQELHEKILYPVTRVRASGAGGSGVLVYSGEDPKKPGTYINVVLTCQHVVDGAIQLRDDWDSVLKKKVVKDFFEEVVIELFDYDGSNVVSANATKGQIIAYDKHHDLAAIRLLNNRKQEYTSQVIPQEEIPKLKLFDPVWVSGCSLLHDPFASSGQLTYLREIIEQKAYLMANASSIFGNSGGGLFHGNQGHLLGLTSRITAIQLGFGVDVMTWMGFSTHPSRLYEFFKHQELQFIYDPADNYYAGAERREKKRKEALRNILLGQSGETANG